MNQRRGHPPRLAKRLLLIFLREDLQGLYFLREQEMPIYYEDRPVGTRRADFVVENNVLLALKAVIKLEDVHLAQGLNYLEAYKIEKGLLLNFGSAGLEVKRLFRKHKQATNNRIPIPILLSLKSRLS